MEDVPHRVKDKFVLVKGRAASKHMLVQSQSLGFSCIETQGPLSLMMQSEGAKTVPHGMAMSIDMTSMQTSMHENQCSFQIHGHEKMESMMCMYSASVDSNFDMELN